MNLALFDFDGTITDRDTYTPFLRYAARPTRLALGRVVLMPVGAGYKTGLLPAARARAAASWVAFRGERADDVRARGERYARTALPSALRPHALERIRQHQAEGDTVVVVSASLNVYLEPWATAHGVHVICTTLEERDGRLTGRYVGGDCSGEEKLVRIQRRYDLSRYERIHAYGDTDEDREILSIAHEPVFCWHPRRTGGRRDTGR
jgi:HAD superfamily hydrolase (TIGR01490 family)